MNMGLGYIFGIAFLVLFIYLGIRFQIWIIKTAIKEALREYDAEKKRGLHIYGS